MVLYVGSCAKRKKEELCNVFPLPVVDTDSLLWWCMWCSNRKWSQLTWLMVYTVVIQCHVWIHDCSIQYTEYRKFAKVMIYTHAVKMFCMIMKFYTCTQPTGSKSYIYSSIKYRQWYKSWDTSSKFQFHVYYLRQLVYSVHFYTCRYVSHAT